MGEVTPGTDQAQKQAMIRRELRLDLQSFEDDTLPNLADLEGLKQLSDANLRTQMDVYAEEIVMLRHYREFLAQSPTKAHPELVPYMTPEARHELYRKIEMYQAKALYYHIKADNELTRRLIRQNEQDPSVEGSPQTDA